VWWRYPDDDTGMEYTDGIKQLADLLTNPIEYVQFEIL
jgi:hypothetical protein